MTGDVLSADVQSGGGGGVDWYDAKEDGGLYGDNSHDDTAAFQALIITATANGTESATIYFPPGTYVLGGALQDTGAFNGQIVFPNISTSNPQITLTLVGASQPPFAYHGYTPNPGGYSILKSTLTGASGTAACISGGNSGQNNIRLVVRDLLCIATDDPTFSFWNLTIVQACDIDGLLVGVVGTWAGTYITQPTHTNSYGIKLPQTNNTPLTTIDHIGAVGFYTGILYGELVDGNSGAALCMVGIEVPFCWHPGGHISLQQTSCPTGIKFTGVNYVDIWYDAEHSNPAAGGMVNAVWAENVYDIDDGSNYWYGSARWQGVLAGSGVDSVFVVNGGLNASWQQIGKISSGAGNVTQDGSVTPGNSTIWSADGLIADGGSPLAGLKIDQAGGTSDTYGVLVGDRNSSNTRYTVSNGAYESGALLVYLNGQLQTQGSSEDWVETDPAIGTFDFIVPPEIADEITAIYGRGTQGPQFYTSAELTTTQSVTTIADLAGCTLTVTLEYGIKYRWRFKTSGPKTSTGTVTLKITDGSNTVLEMISESVLGGLGAVISIEYIEAGTGASVTRKVRASCDSGSFDFAEASDVHSTFSVEKCG